MSQRKRMGTRAPAAEPGGAAVRPTGAGSSTAALAPRASSCGVALGCGRWSAWQSLQGDRVPRERRVPSRVPSPCRHRAEQRDLRYAQLVAAGRGWSRLVAQARRQAKARDLCSGRPQCSIPSEHSAARRRHPCTCSARSSTRLARLSDGHRLCVHRCGSRCPCSRSCYRSRTRRRTCLTGSTNTARSTQHLQPPPLRKPPSCPQTDCRFHR